MPDVTVTPETQSLSVTPETQSLTVNAGAITLNDATFYTSDFPTKTFQMFTHCLDAGQFKVKTGTASATQGQVVFDTQYAAMEHSEQLGIAIGIASLSTVSPSVYNALAEITAVEADNVGILGTFSIGVGDITFRARVKIYDTAPYTTDGMRFAVGLYRFHAESYDGGTAGVSSGNPYEYGISWVKTRDHPHWRLLVSYQTLDEAEEPVYNTYWVNTSVTIDEYHELRVDVPRDGSEARFYCDGSHTATITRAQAGDAFPPVYSSGPNFRFNPSVGVRDARIDGENTLNREGVLRVDYVLFQYETNYF